VVVRDLFDRYRKYGFTVVEIFVDEPGPRVTSWDFWAQERKDIGALQLPWAAGFGERTTYTKLRWGIASTPAAYLLDADGALVWSGDPNKNPSLANAVDTIAGRAP
jgi:hypothetical protein